MKKFEIFPSIFIKHKVKNFNDIFLDLIKAEKYRPSSSVHSGLYTCDTHLLNKKQFKLLKKEILDTAYEFSQKYLCHEVSKLKISCSWGAQLGKGHAIPTHTHINSYISGVIYLTKGCPIKFHSPVLPPHIFPKLSSFNKYNYPLHEVKPKKGLCLMFPSSLSHSVDFSQDSSPRYSIGFNIVPIGKIGFDTASLNLI
jgi:uncharacterized protein (TIGR02466 family)